MARNLCTSKCCGNIVRLSDLRDKPIEFRQIGNEPPDIGTRWDCPSCGTAYFAFWRSPKWSDIYQNWASGFVIDLSYYESYNDEHSYDKDGNIINLDKPELLCLGDAEDQQWVWGWDG